MDNLEENVIKKFMIENSMMFVPCSQSVRALAQSIRQFVSEHDMVQSMYSSSHWPSHFAAISSSLTNHYYLIHNGPLSMVACKIYNGIVTSLKVPKSDFTIGFSVVDLNGKQGLTIQLLAGFLNDTLPFSNSTFEI